MRGAHAKLLALRHHPHPEGRPRATGRWSPGAGAAPPAAALGAARSVAERAEVRAAAIDVARVKECFSRHYHMHFKTVGMPLTLSSSGRPKALTPGG